MRNMRITTKSAKDRIELLDLLFKMGYKWHGQNVHNTGISVEGKYRFSMYPTIIIEGNHLSGTPQSSNRMVYPENIHKIISNLINPEVILEVKNVGDYNAKVHNDKIVVGCQTISFETFDKLAEAVAEQRSKKI